MLSLSKMIFKMTIVHVPTLVSQTFGAIFRPLTHIGTGVGLDRIFDSKIKFFEIKSLMDQTNTHFKDLFSLIKTVPSF